MTRTLSTIQEIQKELDSLSEKKSLAQAQRVILSVIRLLDDSVSVDDTKNFELFNVDNQKISANAQWFYEDAVVVDRRATYKIHAQNNLNIDFKLYGLTKPSKRTISWIQALTPNFEDEPFNSKYNLGIDFVVPKSADRIIIVLSNSYVIRTLELKGALTATYQEIFSKWASISDFSNKKEVHSILWESFDLQPLNKKFYAGISERFITLRQHLTKEDVLDEKHASLFANRLLGRVIFCWFLDKKGIINADKKYFDSESFESDNEYYKTKLENLFFGVLNTPIPDREYKDEVTPFLNGGLFEARDTDLYKSAKLTFPKNYFDDLFGFLSAYNFTTDESTSQFQQVAIDPEMLGRIFENLLAEMTEEDGGQARKAKGAFYTPREIVDYMCRESLKEYLKTKLPEDEHRDQRLEQLIDRPDKEFQDQDHNWRRDWKPYKDSIIKALDELKVLDPACGSGAFPIGMLRLLVRVYERLEARFDPYRTKLQVIEKNIYGVDIEPMAVEIARLRTWLSIIVDEEADSKKIKPLPNLEFKFVCANSLIDLDKSGQVTLYGDDPDLENKLRDIRDAYFNTESLNKKKKLKAEYEKLVNANESLFGTSEKSKQLKTYRPFDNETTASFFNSEFMFGVEKFDVVIGNPPYVRVDKLSTLIKDEYKKTFLSTKGKYDLYYLFFEFGLRVLSKSGCLAYITPNKFCASESASELRSLVLSGNKIQIVSTSMLKVFDSAATYPVISFISKNQQESLSFREAVSINNMGSSTSNNYLIEKTGDFSFPNKVIPINVNQNEVDLILHLLKSKKSLGELIDFSEGLRIKKEFEKAEVSDFPIVKQFQFEKWSTIRKDLYISETDFKKTASEKSDRYKKIISEKILVAEDALEISATLDKDTFIPQGGIYFGTSDDNLLVLGLLNSKLLSKLYKILFGGMHMGGGYLRYRKKFLESLPIPSSFDGKKEEIRKVTESILSEKSKGVKDVSDLSLSLNNLVMDLYGLTDVEKKIIYDSESK